MSLRKQRKLSQPSMAKIIGVHRVSYTNKELGKLEFTQDEMFKISNYFGLPIDQIFLPRSHQNGD